MPPPFSNEEYVGSGATSATQFQYNGQHVVILTNGTQGLKALRETAAEHHPGWNIVHIDAKKSVGGHTLADEGQEGEGDKNKAAAMDIAAALQGQISDKTGTLFVINCKAGQVRSVTLSVHLRAACTKETTKAAYGKLHFAKEQTDAVKGRVDAGL